MPEKLFETLAEAVWLRIRDGEQLGIRQGEETLTDYVLLEMKRARPAGVRVIKTPKDKERNTGTDWEWWIGSPKPGWIRYAVQAKKAKGQNYGSLAHCVGKGPAKKRQIDILEDYASLVKAVPMYCLFNHIASEPVASKGWQCQCQLPTNLAQLGCTVTPLSVVREAIDTRGKRTFQAIHSDRMTLPWRCLVKCPRQRDVYKNPALGIARIGIKPNIWPELPPALADYHEEGEPFQFPPELYPADAVELAPGHIVVVEFSEEVCPL